MRKWLVYLMLLSLVSLSVLPAVPGTPPTLQATTSRQPSPPEMVPANWTTNRVQNPGFENWTSSGDADEWSEDRSGDRGTWYAEAPDPVKSGTYSAGMQVQSPSTGGSEFTYFEQAWPYADMGLLNLTFDWYSNQTQNVGSDDFHVMLGINDSNTFRAMFYFLNGTSPYSNMTTSARFHLGGPVQQWNRFSRNLTADHDAVAEFPSLGPSAELVYFRFILTSAADTTQVNWGFIDNVVLENDTTVWINDTINNGDFEDVAEWNLGYGYEEGYITRSTAVHAGSYSCNLTAASNQRVSEAKISSSPNTRITALNQGSLSFWWNLHHENIPNLSRAYLYLSLYNGTGYLNLYYYLGYGETPYGSNGSNTLIFHVDNFNSTDAWFHCDRNIWQDVAALVSTDEIYLLTLRFYALCKGDNEDSRVTLLVDDVEQIAGAVNGAGFEDQPAVGSPIRGWGGYYIATDDSLRVTSTAYAGSKAAHLDVNSSSVFGDYQPLVGRPIRGSRNTYLDVAWRLMRYTPARSDFACIYVRFGDGKYLYYYFAASSEAVKHNGTLSGYFNVTGINTGGTWHKMHRCLSSDYEAVFGSRPNTTLDTLHLYANASGSNWIELLFDDLYIYDLPTPLNPFILLLPIIVAVVVIIIVLVVVAILVWRHRRSK